MVMLNPGDRCASCGYVMKAAPKREDPRDYLTPEQIQGVSAFLNEPCPVCKLPGMECMCEEIPEEEV